MLFLTNTKRQLKLEAIASWYLRIGKYKGKQRNSKNDRLTFSFTLAAVFPFLFSFLDFLLAGPFAALSVNKNTLITATISGNWHFTSESTLIAQLKNIQHLKLNRSFTRLPFEVCFALKPHPRRPGENLFFVFNKVPSFIHLHLWDSQLKRELKQTELTGGF